MPIALLLPLLPTLIDLVGKIFTAAMQSKDLTADQKAALADLSSRLDATNAEVQALEIRDV